MPSVLIVEDDDYVRDCLYRGFVAEGWTARQASAPGEALEWTDAQSFDLILSDVMMPGMNGAELIRRVRLTWPDTHAILMSGYPESYLRKLACDTEVAPLLQKPFPIRTLLARARALVPA